MTTFTLQDLTPAQLLTDHINVPEVPRETKEVLREILNTQHAPEPQPTLTDIVNNICTQLQLLTTVLSQSQAQPKGENSLQECVSLTLQQADWFKEMVGACIDEDMVRDSVKDVVESEVESYFSNEFDPTYHFDFNDAVSNEVSDQLDDVVRDRLDEVVQEQLEEVVAEKLKSIRVVFD
jgi:hypothetical protein